MKFWRSSRNKSAANDQHERKNGQTSPSSPPAAAAATFQRRRTLFGRAKNGGGGGSRDESVYESFGGSATPTTASPASSVCGRRRHRPALGTTFVELIKRRGTKLGVGVACVAASDDEAATAVAAAVGGGRWQARVASLTSGSWAQRSDVLVVGDFLVAVNGVGAAALTAGATSAGDAERRLRQALEASDRVQLEVRYPLPPRPPPRSRFTRKALQVTLRKEHGTFGMVVRGGRVADDDGEAEDDRPFTVAHVSPGGPAFKQGVIRVNDRIRCVNGVSLDRLKLPELQSLLYRQESEAVFTVEYDVAVHQRISAGPVLVEVRREPADPLGLTLADAAGGAVVVDSVRAAGLADRCGAVRAGDAVLAVGGRPAAGLSAAEVTSMIADNDGDGSPLQLEILPGHIARSSSASLYPAWRPPSATQPPSPAASPAIGRTLRRDSGGSNASTTMAWTQLRSRYRSLTDIDRTAAAAAGGQHPTLASRGRPTAAGSAGHSQTLQRWPSSNANTSGRERRKFVTFTVELQRDGGPLGLTLATEDAVNQHGPIFISALLPDGLAERTRTLQVGDQLVEVDGRDVTDLTLPEVVPMLQEAPDSETTIKLKLARLISIPEREGPATPALRRSHSVHRAPGHITSNGGGELYSDYHFYGRMTGVGDGKPPLPSPSPSQASSLASSSARLPLHDANRASSSHRDSSSSYGHCHSSSSPATPVNMVSLMPANADGSGSVTPVAVHKVILFKDKVYEDFGFSLSDGLYERGIYINRIRRGGPADAAGVLRPLDRILQINGVRVAPPGGETVNLGGTGGDFDCCLAVPLIAAAGDKIELLVARPAAEDHSNAGTLRRSGSGRRRSRGEQSASTAATPQQVRRSGGGDQPERTATVRRRSGSGRLSRTSSADGRLTAVAGPEDLGSLTWEVAPWAAARPALRDGDEAL